MPEEQREINGSEMKVRPGRVNQYRPNQDPKIFNLKWVYSKDDENTVLLSCDTVLPDDTELTFEVWQIKGPVPSPPPSSYKYNKEPEEKEIIGNEVKGMVAKRHCEVSWSYPKDDNDEVIDPYDPERWYQVRDDIPLDDYEAVPDNIEELLLEDDYQPFVFIVRDSKNWALSPSPALREMDLELETDEEGKFPSSALVIGGDGQLKQVYISDGKIVADELPDGPLCLNIPGTYCDEPELIVEEKADTK